ncbi:Phosphotransferase [Coniosporium apollinis]|uniref:Phosphotransferase n=1 Tax=Coniosporium apollinis TaxID=61459 RepID=A0ABQ9NI47_9PEZI|nr:Phosphotransferase [Coniosporium apollinis]
MVYIRQDKLPRLKEYKYSSVDRSLVSKYVLKPFYTNFVIHCFPRSMAPNLITLTGFSFVVANFLTMLWYTPTLDQDCPPWVYASWAIGLFLYQTFDAVDGTQARRTHQSGPLGELFDHGVDACNTTLEVLLFAAAMKFGQGWKTVLTLFASLLTFYVQTWDEYHTRTLTLGIISGPVEGILTLCIVYAITAEVGASFWSQSLLATLGVEKHGFIPDALYNLAWNEWYMVYGGIVLVFNTISSAMNVVAARHARGQRTRIALLGLAPFFTAWLLIPAYLALNLEILHAHLVPFAFYVGLINAYSVGQMITAHLTKSRFPYGNVLLLPLLFGVVDSLGPWLQQHVGLGWPSALGGGVYQVAFVFLCVGMAVGVYGSFVVDVITSICDYLDIWCLSIKHPYLETEQGQVEDKKGK